MPDPRAFPTIAHVPYSSLEDRGLQVSPAGFWPDFGIGSDDDEPSGVLS